MAPSRGLFYVLLLVLGCSGSPSPPAPNRAPSADAGPDQTVALGAEVALDGSTSSDPESAPLQYRWSAASDNPATVLLTPTARVRFVPPAAGVYRFTLEVDDGELKSSASVTITVLGSDNRPPVADAGPELIFQLGDTVVLDAGGSSDPDGDALSYRWEVVEAPPAFALADSTARQIQFRAALSGEYRFRLRVSDGQLSASDEVRITVASPDNLLPIADAGSDQSLTLGEAVTLDGSASSDPDGDGAQLSFIWSVGRTPGAAVILSDSTAARPTFTPTAAGDYVFALVVVDSQGGRSLQDLVSISVLPPKFNEVAGMIEIPAGAFIMGSDTGFADEAPPHQVELKAFWIDKFELTAAEYQACADAGACTPAAQTLQCNAGQPGRQDHPINCVTWEQAGAYCAWAQKRLPTEAEWEKAARGTDGRRFPWGDAPPDPLRLNFNNNLGSTAPVDSFPAGASFYGLQGMGGNVSEWTADYFAPDYYASSPAVDPQGPAAGTLRVGRGGSWNTGLDDRALTATVRNALNPTRPVNSVGFRCARTQTP